jgi:hypothetical protein
VQRRVGVERAGIDGFNRGVGVDGSGPAVGSDTDRDGTFGDNVGELAPRIDEFVEVLVQGLKWSAVDVPATAAARPTAGYACSAASCHSARCASRETGGDSGLSP